MKKTWVNIPDVLFFQEGPGIRNTQYTSEGVKLLNVANLVNGKIDLSTSNRYISEEDAYGKYKHFLCAAGDFIIASSGIKVEYIDKKMGFVSETMLPLCMNTSTIRFKVLNPNELRIRYFMYYLKSKHFKRQLEKQITGSAQLNYGPSHLKKMFMPLVEVSVQDGVVNKLDKVQKLIEMRMQELAYLDELIKARFVELFGDLADPDCPWTYEKLSDICSNQDDIKCGPFGTQLNKDEYRLNGVAVWEIPQINSQFTTAPTHFLTAEKAQQLDSYSIRPGDIAMSRKGNVGKCAVFPKKFKPGIIHSDVLRIRVDEKRVSPIFMMYQLHISKAVQQQIELVSSGAIMAGINVTKLKQINVHTPPTELQQQFTAFVTQIDKSKAAVQKALEETKLLFDSLMHKYFG